MAIHPIHGFLVSEGNNVPQRKVEFSSTNGTGGLISFTETENGILVEPYRMDETVKVRVPGENLEPYPVDSQDLLAVSYSPHAEVYTVSARRTSDDAWTTLEGTAEEVDMLMSQARDIMFGDQEQKR